MSPDTILSFWIDEVGPKGWYSGGADLDAEITDRFHSTWEEALNGACGLWLTSPSGTLAYVILTDQFPRNMFRDSSRAFASDKSARAAAKIAINRDWDLRIAEPARQFFYMPLMHSENLIDQDRCVRLMHCRMSPEGTSLIHARTHREVIRQFGRFPYRNAALGRVNTEAEQSYLDGAGYRGVLASLEAEKQAA